MRACVDSGILCVATYSSMAMLSVALVFSVVRLLRGPSTPDRVVALDLAAMLVVGIISVYAVMTNEVSLLAGALIVALIAFLGAIAFARYLEKKASG